MSEEEKEELERFVSAGCDKLGNLEGRLTTTIEHDVGPRLYGLNKPKI